MKQRKVQKRILHPIIVQANTFFKIYTFKNRNNISVLHSRNNNLHTIKSHVEDPL